jgi:hypothetical protein
MGIDIAGATIIKNAGGGVTLNMLVFNAAGQGSANPNVGYAGYKNGGDGLLYSTVTGWPVGATFWNSGLNGATGVFTCPIAGIYAMGFNDLWRGGSNFPSGQNTYAYGAFCKNGVMSYHSHNNDRTDLNYWEEGGFSHTFVCQAGDTLALFVNRAPSPVNAGAQTNNLGANPDSFGGVWCRMVG